VGLGLCIPFPDFHGVYLARNCLSLSAVPVHCRHCLNPLVPCHNGFIAAAELLPLLAYPESPVHLQPPVATARFQNYAWESEERSEEIHLQLWSALCESLLS
jgi:hypothetical protein